MPRRLNLRWQAATVPLTWPWGIALAAALTGLLASTMFYWQATAKIETLAVPRAETARLSSSRHVRLDEKSRAELRDEIQAANQLIRQLNQQWDALLADVQPPKPTVRLLELDVDARRQRMRIVGRTAKTAEMIDYVAALANRPSLANVGLARHDVDKDSGGYRFVVEATWSDGR